MSEKIKEELNLLLIYLTGWEEEKRNSPGQKVIRAWKGYQFNILNELERQRLIYQVPGGNSLYLTEKGIQRVLTLKHKYFTIGERSGSPSI